MIVRPVSRLCIALLAGFWFGDCARAMVPRGEVDGAGADASDEKTVRRHINSERRPVARETAALIDRLSWERAGGFAHMAAGPMQRERILRQPARYEATSVEVPAAGDDPREAEWRRLYDEAVRLHDAAKYAAALEKAEAALRLAESTLGPDHPSTLDSLETLALIYQEQGRYAEAEPLYKRVLEANERVRGKEHPSTLDAVNNLASLYQDRGRYAEAETLYLRAVEVSERVRGPDHPDTLISKNNLASLYQDLIRYHEAERLYGEVLKTRERVLGKDHPDTLVSVNNLATLYLDQGRYAEAERSYGEVLKARERVLGKDHPDTLSSLNNLATCYLEQGRYAEAEPLYRRAAAASERVLGKEHPDTLLFNNNLAGLYVDQGRYAEAEALYARVRAARERLFGKEHPETLNTAHDIGALYLAQGRFAQAEAVFLFVLEARGRLLGEDHSSTLASAATLASLLQYQGRLAEAERLIERVVGAQQRVLGREHPDTLWSQSLLADIYIGLGSYSNAEDLLYYLLNISEHKFGNDHPLTLYLSNNLGRVYRALGLLPEAEELFIQAIKERERIFGKDHRDTIASVSGLALVYYDQGRLDLAEPLFVRAFKASERERGSEHPATLVDMNNLAALYKEQGRLTEAEPLYVRAFDASGRALGKGHRLTIVYLENYLIWRAEAGAAGLDSRWKGDAVALRLLTDGIEAVDSLVAARGSWRHFDNPNSPESRAARLVSAFERARRAGVAGSGTPEIAGPAAKLLQRLTLSSVASALAASSARLADPARRKLLDERTRLGREITDRLQALDKIYAAEPRNPNAEASIKADIDGLRKQAAVVTAELRKGDAGRAEIDGVVDAEDLRAVGASLPTDEALILYSSVGGRLLAFVASRRGIAAVSLDVRAADLAAKVKQVRKGLRLPFRIVDGKEVPSTNPHDLPAFDLDKAGELHRILIAPFAAELEGVSKLVIVADGALQSLPFGVLVEEAGDAALPPIDRYKASRYLVDRYALSLQPSVSAIRTLRAKTPRASGDRPLLGFADPVLKPQAGAPSRAGGGGAAVGDALIIQMGGPGDAGSLEDLDPLPQTRALLDAIGASLGADSGDLRYGAKASEADFRALDEALPDYRMIAFATHALVSDEIEALKLSEPALVMSLPPIAPGTERPWENDGLLRASDIVGFEMDADLVILAACNTASPDGAPGAEPLSGLAKAFMLKGARALLVSHWQADAGSSATLIPEMTREARTVGFSEGLARAQRSLRAGAAAPFNLHYAHPAIWGAFALIGDPGR